MPALAAKNFVATADLAQALDELAVATPATADTALYKAACRFGESIEAGLEPAEAWRQLEAAVAGRSAFRWTDIEKTIESGIWAGRQPRRQPMTAKNILDAKPKSPMKAAVAKEGCAA